MRSFKILTSSEQFAQDLAVAAARLDGFEVPAWLTGATS